MKSILKKITDVDFIGILEFTLLLPRALVVSFAGFANIPVYRDFGETGAFIAECILVKRKKARIRINRPLLTNS